MEKEEFEELDMDHEPTNLNTTAPPMFPAPEGYKEMRAESIDFKPITVSEEPVKKPLNSSQIFEATDFQASVILP